MDVVDTGDLPLASFPHFNQGLTLADAVACLEVVCSAWCLLLKARAASPLALQEWC